MSFPTEYEANAVESGLFLRSLGLGRPVGEAAEVLSRMIAPFYARAGTTLHEQGSALRWIYYIVSGSVELRSPDAPPWRFGPGDTLGVHDLFIDRPCARAAVASTDASLFRIRADQYLQVLEDNHDFTRALLNSVGMDLFTMRADAQRAEPTDWSSLLNRVALLRACPPFSRARVQSLIDIAEALHEARLEAGAALPREIAHHRLALVASGAAALRVPGDDPALRYTTAMVLGGYASFAGPVAPEAATIVADAVLLHLDREDMYAIVDDHFDLARSILAGVATERETRRASST